MKILFYGLNFYPEIVGAGKYSGEMVDYFLNLGHEVRVVTSPPYYPEWRIWNGYENFYSVAMPCDSLKVFRCPLFVPGNPKTLSRIIHLLSFAITSAPVIYSQLFWRPDVVIQVAPTLICAPATLIFSRLSGSKSLLHVQDFEVDAMLGLGLFKNGMLARGVKLLEKIILRLFDSVSTISSAMLDNARAKGVHSQRLLYCPNWVDMERYHPGRDRLEFRRKLNIDPHKKVVLYSGNLGEKQGLGVIVDAAEAFLNQSEVVFLIAGEGPAKINLQKRVNELNLPNVLFLPFLDDHDFPGLLASADIHLVVQRRGVADAVLPSKLAPILAVGGYALVTAESNTELGRMVASNPGVAYVVTPESTSDFVAGLQHLLSRELSSPNDVACDYARQNFRKDAVLGRMAAAVQHLVTPTSQPSSR